MSESGYSSDESFNEKEYYQSELERFKKKYEINSRISSGNGQVFNGLDRVLNIPDTLTWTAQICLGLCLNGSRPTNNYSNSHPLKLSF